jgi:hypothetical protein
MHGRSQRDAANLHVDLRHAGVQLNVFQPAHQLGPLFDRHETGNGSLMPHHDQRLLACIAQCLRRILAQVVIERALCVADVSIQVPCKDNLRLTAVKV